MSFLLPASSIPEEVIRNMSKELVVKKETKKFARGFANAERDEIVAFAHEDDRFLLPFAWTIQNVPGVQRKPRESCKAIDLTFTGTLRAIQNEVRPEVVQSLNSGGSVVLSLCPGAGKTAFTIFLSTKIKLQTLIICHRVILMNQFKETIERFVPNARAQVLSTKSAIDPEADYYIVNATTVEKLGFVFDRVGLVIVDEVHCISTKSLIKSLFYVCPRYIIGLSATPYRSDGLDRLLDLYFGSHQVIRNLQRYHDYVQLQTGLVPEVSMNVDGTINWDSVLSWQASSEQRNRLIIDITQRYKDRNWLILCKRKEQGRTLIAALEELGEDVTYLMADKNDYNIESRIVVVTVQKCGVGFSHDKLNGLIIASDVEEYFIQYLGRVFRTEDGVPLVFDLIDKQTSLQRHASTRKKVAVEALARVHKLTMTAWAENNLRL